MKIKGKILMILLLIILPAGVWGQSIEEQEKRKRQIEEEIAFLDSQLSSTKKKQADNTKELNFIRRKIANRKKLLAQIETEIREINKEMTRNEGEINKLSRNLDHLKREYSNLI